MIEINNQEPQSTMKSQREQFTYREDIIINKVKLLEKMEEFSGDDDIITLRKGIESIKMVVNYPKNDLVGLVNIEQDGDVVVLKRSILLDELNQIQESQTIERAKYYLGRLKKGINELKTSKINDINLNRWKEYEEIITDSLWIMDKRDNSGVHSAWYWGNFVPQIPHQLILRYTKKNDWVLDPFLGSGTTLIECCRLERNGVGIELNPEVQAEARKLIAKEHNHHITAEVICGDSRQVDLKETMDKLKIKKFQMMLMHPPYYDIIKFSKNPNDLSNAFSAEVFVQMFGEVLDHTVPYLEKGRYLGIVIGDKYHKGTWIPLGFYLMNEVLKRGFTLKSIIVKNFEETKGKRNQKELWRYRALVGGFYIFKHEYIFLFKS